MKGLASGFGSGLLLPERSKGLSPDVGGGEARGYFGLDPRSSGESSSAARFLAAPMDSSLCLLRSSWAACSWANWAAYRFGLRASSPAGSRNGFFSRSMALDGGGGGSEVGGETGGSRVVAITSGSSLLSLPPSDSTVPLPKK